MHVVNDEGKILEHVYRSHDRFLEDLGFYIKNYFDHGASTDTFSLLDQVCAHLMKWEYKTLEEDEGAKNVYHEIQKNEVLRRFTELGYSIPELVIYEFDGTSVYDDFGSKDVEPDEKFENFTATLRIGYTLMMSKEDFEEMGGEVILPDDETDEVTIEYRTPSDVYFFMSEDSQQEMHEYLLKCVMELNKIYSYLGLKMIEQ
jgi:hypothetical protein